MIFSSRNKEAGKSLHENKSTKEMLIKAAYVIKYNVKDGILVVA